MNAISINACFLLVYAGVFIWQCVQYRQWLWLVSSAAIWLVLGACSVSLFPGLGGVLHWGNLFLCHFYVFAGAWFVLLARQTAQLKHAPYLNLLLKSSVVLHVSWLILLGLAWWKYPNGLSVIFANGLMQMYLWQPAFWLTSQWLIMLLWWLADVITAGNEKEKQKTSKQSWQIGLLLAILWQAAYSFAVFLRLV